MEVIQVTCQFLSSHLSGMIYNEITDMYFLQIISTKKDVQIAASMWFHKSLMVWTIFFISSLWHEWFPVWVVRPVFFRPLSISCYWNQSCTEETDALYTSLTAILSTNNSEHPSVGITAFNWYSDIYFMCYVIKCPWEWHSCKAVLIRPNYLAHVAHKQHFAIHIFFLKCYGNIWLTHVFCVIFYWCARNLKDMHIYDMMLSVVYYLKFYLNFVGSLFTELWLTIEKKM